MDIEITEHAIHRFKQRLNARDIDEILYKLNDLKPELLIKENHFVNTIKVILERYNISLILKKKDNELNDWYLLTAMLDSTLAIPRHKQMSKREKYIKICTWYININGIKYRGQYNNTPVTLNKDTKYYTSNSTTKNRSIINKPKEITPSFISPNTIIWHNNDNCNITTTMKAISNYNFTEIIPIKKGFFC
jgi:hypothetical protein